jgi:hypothetical protein
MFGTGNSSTVSAVTAYPYSGTNQASALIVVPKGTGHSASLKAQLSIFNTDFEADSSNYEAFVFRSAGTHYGLFESAAGSGNIRDIRITTASNAATPQLTLATSSYTAIGNETAPDAILELKPFSGSDVVLHVKGTPSQTGPLLWLTDNADLAYINSGDGRTNSEFVGNEQGVDINFRWEGNTEPNLNLVDAGNDQVRHGDGTANYFVTDKVGDSWWVGGGGIQYGSCYGNEIGWTQAAAVQNTWYDISDSDMADGGLHGITHDGNGKLTVGKAGWYKAHWSGSFEANAANVHIQISFSVNGTETVKGMNHFETFATDRQSPSSGFTHLDLAASDTVNVSIRTTDAGTPDLAIDHLMLSLEMVGGT